MHGMRNSAGPFTASLVTGLVLALLLWGGELVRYDSPGWLTSFAGLFFLLVVLLPVALGIGTYYAVVSGGVNPYLRLADATSRAGHFLTTPDRSNGWRVFNGIFWLLLYLAGTILLAYLLSHEIAVEIVRPRYQAILSLASVAGTVLLFLPLLRFGFAFGRRIEGPANGIPILRRLWSRPLYPILLLTGVIAAAVTIFVVVFKDAILAAPWQTPMLLAGTVLFAMALGGMLSAAFSMRWITILMGTVLLSITTISALAALSLSGNDSKSRRFFQRMPATRLAYGLLTRAFDRDGDGFMHPFAGGDCAPDNPGISPVAIDIPGNGIDEDCNGGDLEFALLARGRWDFERPTFYPEKPLPVFLITADALAADHVGFMGYSRDTTPNLDQWADRCVVFEKAFAQGPSTRLSVASFLTGLHDTQIERGEGRKVPYPLLPENQTLAETFRDSGYDTVFVSPNSYFHSRWKGVLQGFETIEKLAAAKSLKGVSHNAGRMTREAIKHLNKRRDRPLFMWVHYYDMHPPFGQPAGVKSFGKSRQDRYDAEIRYWDSEAIKLLQAIDEKHKQNGYVLIISADHGSAFDDNHEKHSHGYDLHSAVLHVPMLFCSRDFLPRRVEQTTVGLMDIAPTLVNLNGLTTDVPFEGTSLLPLLFDALEWPDRVLFHQFYLAEKIRKGQDPLYAASTRNSRYNYMWDRREDEYFLFDYQQDPQENHNLLEERPDVARTMDAMLKTWLYRVRNDYMKGHFESETPYDDGGPYGYDAVYD